MKITKLGHSCLLVEEKTLRILIDPGNYSTAQNQVKNLDAILITQEHQDHFELGSIRTVLANNPQVKILTNRGVGKILDHESIPYELLEHGQIRILKEVLIEGFGEKHAVIYPGYFEVVNTGYLIGSRFFHPGDALVNPEKNVEILALPICGPWLKISEAIDYAKSLRPKICFPIHDGMLKILGGFHKVPEKVLADLGIKFVVLEERKECEF